MQQHILHLLFASLTFSSVGPTFLGNVAVKKKPPHSRNIQYGLLAPILIRIITHDSHYDPIYELQSVHHTVMHSSPAVLMWETAEGPQAKEHTPPLQIQHFKIAASSDAPGF